LGSSRPYRHPSFSSSLHDARAADRESSSGEGDESDHKRGESHVTYSIAPARRRQVHIYPARPNLR
jgi:hypothetical protein